VRIQCDGRNGTHTHFGNSADCDRCATVTDHGMNTGTEVSFGCGFRAGAAEVCGLWALGLDATVHMSVLAAGRQREAEDESAPGYCKFSIVAKHMKNCDSVVHKSATLKVESCET
jgi:hypothetical protein